MDRAVKSDLAWQTLPRVARFYVSVVMIGGTVVFVETFPVAYPHPILFLLILVSSCLTAAWKVTLPIPLVSGSTLSVSYASKLMALLMLGPQHAIVVGVVGALTQCTYKVRQSYPIYRTVFSMAAEAVTMLATGFVFGSLGGSIAPIDMSVLARPLVGAIGAYLIVNTSLVAGAIGLSTGRRIIKVWRDDFLWSGITFIVAGSAGAVAAIVIDRGHVWIAILMLAPVYLTYRTYELFVARLEDQQAHMAEMRRMHQETVDALSQAHQAERALAAEKERLAGMLAEMTRLEEMQHELFEREQIARASAEEANRLKDQFLAVVSHELRTPLNAILGWADMLRGGKLDEGRRARATHVIFDSATRQAQLIDDLLDLARIMSGKLRLEQTLVDMDDVLRGALSVVQPAADAKRVHLRVDVDPAIDRIYGDKARLQQIAWNLLSNAIKFTPEGGTVGLRLRVADQGTEMIVTDTGEGIPRDFLPSVFEPFRQADGSTTRPHAGLGLGLSIVKHLVEAHGGVVSAQSGGEGQGATFIVRLPVAGTTVARGTAAVADRAGASEAELPPSLAGLSVLVVDDDEAGRQVVAAQLEASGAAVVMASSAAQALNLLQCNHFDVLLADIAMPIEDGYSLIRKVRGLYPSPLALIPAAALTAFARNEDKLQAIHAGFQFHLVKPIDAYSLVSTVARLGGRFPERRQPGSLTLNGSLTIQ